MGGSFSGKKRIESEDEDNTERRVKRKIKRAGEK